MALRLFSQRPLAERREKLRRHWGIVSGLISGITLPIFVVIRIGGISEWISSLLIFSLIYLYMLWWAMWVNLLIWTAVLWARGRIRRRLPPARISSGSLETPEANGWCGHELSREASQLPLYEARRGVPALWRQDGNCSNSSGRGDRIVD